MSTEQPVTKAIKDKLMKAFEPTHLEIINESYKHNVPKGAETHFKVLVVTEKFTNIPLLKVIILFLLMYHCLFPSKDSLILFNTCLFTKKNIYY